jgi:hypothetical protein
MNLQSEITGVDIKAVQLSFEIHEHENNCASECILKANKERFSNQCKIVYEALQRGERLTTASALLKYSIGDLRRRIKDLRDAGIPIEDELQENRFKIYFIKQAS